MIDLSKANIQNINTYNQNINADILRIDKINSVVSGNKWFKLKYHLEEIKKNNYKTILTFGGAYSNHIVATAFTANQLSLKSIGVIRGEESINLSHTLKDCLNYGMKLKFISRTDYKNSHKDNFIKDLNKEFGNFYLIPEGGAGELGRLGAEDILKLCNYKKYTHIICAIGTGTMFLGIANASNITQNVIGIPVLKEMSNFLEQNKMNFKDIKKIDYCKIFPDYHFGGYAKKNNQLLEFMNNLYKENDIPTDFVYTSKLLYAFFDLLKHNYFPDNSNILLIHSGGLQGNLSLNSGLLDY
jgi:1-aminocyclopropane-1-carboxylate deaminase